MNTNAFFYNDSLMNGQNPNSGYGTLPVNPTMPVPMAGQTPPQGAPPAVGPENTQLDQFRSMMQTLQDPNQLARAAQFFGQKFEVPNFGGFGQIPPPLGLGGPQIPSANPMPLGQAMQPGALPPQPQQQQQAGLPGIGQLLAMIPGLGGSGGGGFFNPTDSNLAAAMTKT